MEGDRAKMEQDRAAGAAAYFKNKKAWKDAVASGAIPAGASPAFEQAYQEMDLRQKGFDLQDQLVQAYHDQNIGANTDPEVFKKFVADGINNFIQNTQGYDDKAIASVLIPQTNQIQSALHAQYAQDRAHTIEQGFVDTAEQEVARIIDTGQAAHADPKAVGGQISSLLSHYVASGLDGKKANKLAVNSIVNYALQNNSLDALHAIDAISTGNGGMLGRTLYAREQVAQAHDQIVRTQMAYEERQQRLAEKAQAAALKHAEGVLFAQIIADPHVDITSQAQAVANLGEPNIASAMLAFRETRLDAENKVRENPSMIAHIYDQLRDSPDDASSIIAQHAAMGDISDTSVKDFNRFANDLSRNKDVFQQDWFKQLKSPYVSAITGNTLDFTPEKQFRAAKFEQALHDDVGFWLSKHRDPKNGGYDAEALRQFMIKDMDGLMRSYQAVDESTMNQFNAPAPANNTPAPAAPDWAQSTNAAPDWAQ
jgi:hypothetical protein